jgi:hypothetical protein
MTKKMKKKNLGGKVTRHVGDRILNIYSPTAKFGRIGEWGSGYPQHCYSFLSRTQHSIKLFYVNHGKMILRIGFERLIFFSGKCETESMLLFCFAALFTVNRVSCSSAMRNCLFFLVKGCFFLLILLYLKIFFLILFKDFSEDAWPDPECIHGSITLHNFSSEY